MCVWVSERVCAWVCAHCWMFVHYVGVSATSVSASAFNTVVLKCKTDRPGFSTVFRFRVYSMYFIEGTHSNPHNIIKDKKWSHLSWSERLFVCDTKEWLNALCPNVYSSEIVFNSNTQQTHRFAVAAVQRKNVSARVLNYNGIKKKFLYSKC